VSCEAREKSVIKPLGYPCSGSIWNKICDRSCCQQWADPPNTLSSHMLCTSG